MSIRWALVLVALVIGRGALAQPWPEKDAKAATALDSLVSGGVESGAITKAKDPKTRNVLLEVASADKLAAALRGAKSSLTDSVTDDAVLRWRDDAPNRAFWTQYLRAIATATERRRDSGFADLLEGVAASGDAKTVGTAEKRYATARDHFKAAKDPAWEAAAENEIGNLALALERFAAADAAYARAVELYSTARGAKSPLVAASVRNRGNVAYRQQKHTAAAVLYSEAIKILGADDGPNARQILDCLQNLASAYTFAQELPAAKDAADRGLAIIRRLEGESSARELPFLESLGQIYRYRGENDKARDIAARAIEIARKVYGDKSAATVRYVSTQADCELTLGNKKLALQMHQEALAILEEQPAKDETEIADLRARIGADHVALAELDKAVAEYGRALAGYRKGTTRRDRIGEILTLEDLAQIAKNQGKRDEAVAKSREAIQAAAKTLGPAHPFVGARKRSLGIDLLAAGAYLEGAAELHSAREPIDKAARPIEWADLTTNYAMALELADQIGDATRELNEAVAIYRREQHPNLANAYLTLAALHRRRDEFEEAARVHRQALDIKKKTAGPNDPSVLPYLSLVIQDLHNAKQYAEAEVSLRELVALTQKLHGSEHPEYAKVLVKIATMKADMGQFSKALETCEHVLKLQRASKGFSVREKVANLMSLSEVLDQCGKADQALAALDEVLTILRESGTYESSSGADALEKMGYIFNTKGDAKNAEDRYVRALEIHRKQKAVGLSGGLVTLKRLAGLRGEAGDHAGALKHLDEGLKALAVEPATGRIPWKISSHTVELLGLKAEVLFKSDPKSVATKKAAHQLLVTAGEITDRLRGERQSSPDAQTRLIGDQQVEQIQSRLVLCEELARAEPDGGWAVAAFRAAEEGRARVFLEQLGRNRSGVVGDLPPALADRERKGAQELARLQRELEAVEAAPFDKRDAARVAALQKAIGDANRTFDEVQATIARDHPRVAALRRPYPCSLPEARAVLGKNEVAVIYCCGKATSSAIVLQPAGEVGDGITIVPLAGTDEFEDDFEVLISEGNLKIPDLYRGKAAKIYGTLIKPLEKVIGDRDLLIVPDGKLGLLPFEVLIDAKGRFLIESRTVRMAPSMTALHLNNLWEKKRARPARAVLAVGDPVTTSKDARHSGRDLLPSARRVSDLTGVRFDRLVHSGREATAVADVFKAPAEDRWLGLDAAEGRLKSWNASGRLADYCYLHFATHGFLGAGRTVPPALVLSLVPGQPPDTEDGLLNVMEVIELRLNADLVVLSACRSAHGELHTGEGITGLARGFLNAGTRGVVCSLWAVDDRDTAALMVEFYNQIGRGVPAATALRDAKLRLIREGRHPYDWAPFVLVGASN